MQELTEKIINMERAALDRWGKGDPGGYLEIIAPETSYFDPFTKNRIDGLSTFKEYLAPITGKIHIANSTEIYRRIESAWKIVHSHWSYTKTE